MAVPPDDLPAGSCPTCGKTWCIGCAKANLDNEGRFICKECGKPLKLINEGLKKLLYDWASQSGLTKKQSKSK
jgi:transcription elongation factor Elf1